MIIDFFIAGGDVVFDLGDEGVADGDDTLFAAFTEDTYLALLQVYIRVREP